MSNYSTWQPIETAPRDGVWFVTCNCNASNEYEIGCYNPLMMDRYVEVGDGLFRKDQEKVYDWTGFNNFHRATHWMPVPNPPEGT